LVVEVAAVPVSRQTTEGLAEQVAGVYGNVEVRLLRLIADRLAAGADSPRWAEDKLAEIQTLRARAQRIVRAARREASDAVGDVTLRAYLHGQAAGQGDLDDLGVELDDDPPGTLRLNHPAVAKLVEAQAEALEALEVPVVRQATDAFRAAVVRASAGTLTGATTRLQDAQYALDDLARRGLSGFTDTAGRRWGLRSYVEMATRTTTAQASVAGHLDRLDQGGIPLVIVSESSRECETCRPWEGKVLSRGPVSAMMPNVVTGKMERVDIDGTVDEATRAGLFHPNCTHNLSGYLPGATRRGDATSSPEGYAEKVEQRRLERKVREWKLREAAAVTPEAKRKATAKVREWQGQVKDHTAATGLPRKRNRESLTAAR
jgi:hypothetical protein